MTFGQSVAVIDLWRSTHFDTFDIAKLLSVSEADVVRVLNAVRDREYGPDLRVVS